MCVSRSQEMILQRADSAKAASWLPAGESDCNILYQLPAAGAKQSLTSQNSDRKLFCAKVLTFLRDQNPLRHCKECKTSAHPCLI